MAFGSLNFLLLLTLLPSNSLKIEKTVQNEFEKHVFSLFCFLIPPPPVWQEPPSNPELSQRPGAEDRLHYLPEAPELRPLSNDYFTVD